MGSKNTTISLKGWQEDVIKEIGLYEERRDEQAAQGVADFALNKMLSVTVAFPKASGHTYLANHIASQYPTLLIYGKMNHYRDVTSHFTLHRDTETVSLYEIFYAMYKNSQHGSLDLLDIRKKFEGKKCIVIDNALSVSEDIKHFVYDSARGVVVMLGH